MGIDLYLVKDILVIDDFLSKNDFEWFVDKYFEKPNWWQHSWNTGHDKHNESMWMWHRPLENDQNHMGTEGVKVDQMVPHLRMLWDRIDEKILNITGIKHRPERMYSNLHTYGYDGYTHTDDGNLTALYYPCRSWDVLWEGGTLFYNDDETDCIKYCSLRPNRLVLFDPRIPHRPAAITKDCRSNRVSIAVKTIIDTSDVSYMEYYYDNQGH